MLCFTWHWSLAPAAYLGWKKKNKFEMEGNEDLYPVTLCFNHWRMCPGAPKWRHLCDKSKSICFARTDAISSISQQGSRGCYIIDLKRLLFVKNIMFWWNTFQSWRMHSRCLGSFRSTRGKDQIKRYSIYLYVAFILIFFLIHVFVLDSNDK